MYQDNVLSWYTIMYFLVVKMEYQFESYGKIIYDPPRGSMKKRTKWWCVVELEQLDMVDYYRWLIDRHWWMADSSTIKRRYHRPVHWPHISVIRGEVPRRNKSDWGKFMSGQRVKFRYTNQVRQTSNAYYAEEPDKFWFVDVQWDDYNLIRDHFGLNIQRDGRPFRGHVTVAKTYD